MSCDCCTPGYCPQPRVYSEIVSGGGDWDGTSGDKGAAQGRALANMASYTGLFTPGVPFAAVFLTFGGRTCTVSGMRYKFAVGPSASCYLKAKWVERLVPDIGASSEGTAHNETWQGSGAPCFPAGFLWSDDTTWDYFPGSGGHYEIAPPAVEGRIYVADFFWTCIPGAEPTGAMLPGDAGAFSDGVNELGDEPPGGL